jgi:esterase/lipase superfamily enzyme
MGYDGRREIAGWYSQNLGQQMPIVSYGHWGHPVLLFPTAAADFLENERFGLIGSLQPALDAGRVRVFSINSINNQAWMDRNLPVPEQGRRQALYARYVEEEVAPFIRQVCQSSDLRIVTSGASFGAFHAANTLFRRPDLFDGVIAMSGFYDLGPDYLRGYGDDNTYFNNPASYLPNLEG